MYSGFKDMGFSQMVHCMVAEHHSRNISALGNNLGTYTQSQVPPIG